MAPFGRRTASCRAVFDMFDFRQGPSPQPPAVSFTACLPCILATPMLTRMARSTHVSLMFLCEDICSSCPPFWFGPTARRSMAPFERRTASRKAMFGMLDLRQGLPRGWIGFDNFGNRATAHLITKVAGAPMHRANRFIHGPLRNITELEIPCWDAFRPLIDIAMQAVVGCAPRACCALRSMGSQDVPKVQSNLTRRLCRNLADVSRSMKVVRKQMTAMCPEWCVSCKSV